MTDFKTLKIYNKFWKNLRKIENRSIILLKKSILIKLFYLLFDLFASIRFSNTHLSSSLCCSTICEIFITLSVLLYCLILISNSRSHVSSFFSLEVVKWPLWMLTMILMVKLLNCLLQVPLEGIRNVLK